MDKSEIENVVIQILYKDGPDGHCDGYKIITDFVLAVRNRDEYSWKEKYYKKNKIKD